MKRLSGFTPTTRPDSVADLQHVVGENGQRFPELKDLACFINNAFLAAMSEFSPLELVSPVHTHDAHHREPESMF